jgi:C4-dicarboxylate-specific signal transduction histidine kinase
VIEQNLSMEPLSVRVDVVQIEQVFLNLIRNALDALLEVPQDQRHLVLRTGCHGDSIQVDVVDSGPGIDADTAERLFEPFFTTKQSGMGMGLVISKTIVEDHNGRIQVRPAPDGGAWFSVILPRYHNPNVAPGDR